MAVGDFVLRLLPASVAARINKIPFARRIARGAFWTLVGAAAARVLRIPVSIFLARFMGPTRYGELGIIIGSIDLFSIFAGLGLGLTATKYIAEFRVKDPERAGRILAVSTGMATVTGVIFAILLYFMAPWLAAHTLAAPQLVGPLRIGACVLFFSATTGAQSGALYGFEAFHVMAQVQTIIGILELPLLVGGYLLGGLNGVVWGTAGSRFASWVLMNLALRKEARRHHIPIVFKEWTQELSVIWHFSIPAALGGIMVIPVNWACTALLVNQPRGYAEMGAYNAANQWYAALIFLPTALGSGLLPLLSDRMGQKDGKTSGDILKVMMKLNAAIILPAAVIMSFLSPLVMRLYGRGYRDAWPTLIAVLATAGIMAVISPVGDVIAASGKMWLGLLMNAAWATVYVTSTLLLVHWGSMGLASARLIAYAFHAVWTVGFAYTVIRRQAVEERLVSQEHPA